MKKSILLTVLLTVICAPPLSAVTVSGLYQTNIEVVDESITVRNKALGQALSQVLIKLTGNRMINQEPAAAAIIENAQTYVQQFRYRQTAAPNKTGAALLELQVKFDETVLNNVMRSNGLSLQVPVDHPRHVPP